MCPIELKTVRPFIYKELVLKTVDEMNNMNDGSLTLVEFTLYLVRKKLDEMITAAKSLGRDQRVSKRPLIRLNVRCRDERQVFNTIRFGQDYIGKVANPEDIVKCSLMKDRMKRGKDSDREIEADDIASANRVEDIVSSFFQEKDTLKLFPVSAINEAVKKFIDANDTDSVSDVTELYKKQILKKLVEDMPEIQDVDKAISILKTEKEEEALRYISKILNDPKRQQNNLACDSNPKVRDDDEAIIMSDPQHYPNRPQKKSKQVPKKQTSSAQTSRSSNILSRIDEEACIIDDDDDDGDNVSESFTDLDSDHSEATFQEGPRRYFLNPSQRNLSNTRGSRSTRVARRSRGARSRAS